jgi:hypothetical protein
VVCCLIAKFVLTLKFAVLSEVPIESFLQTSYTIYFVQQKRHSRGETHYSELLGRKGA